MVPSVSIRPREGPLPKVDLRLFAVCLVFPQLNQLWQLGCEADAMKFAWLIPVRWNRYRGSARTVQSGSIENNNDILKIQRFDS